MSQISNLIKEVHQTALSKGWWEEGAEGTSFGEKIALCHTELSEALEQYRYDRRSKWLYINTQAGTYGKPEGVAVELADTIIRILDMCAWWEIDIESALEKKIAYNKTRPYRHGGKVL